MSKAAYSRPKRVLDLVIAVPLFVVAAPVMLAVAVWVRRDSPGPVVFRQERVGLHGRPFRLLKFRTMVVGAERLGAGLAIDRDDPRITRAGATLRRLSLDELPQLWNVIRGDMSIVGPRPTVAAQVARFRRGDSTYVVAAYAAVDDSLRNAVTIIGAADSDGGIRLSLADSARPGRSGVMIAGMPVMVGVEVVEKALEAVGIAFMMAPVHHPAIRHVMPTRAELGTRTIFNLLGPLTNPAGVKRQLTGAFSRAWIRPMAETLAALGSERAWLVHGADGTDEISIAGLTWVAALDHGVVTEFELHPDAAGLPVHPFEAIMGGSPQENAVAFRALLAGEKGAYRDAVLFNAAAALVVADKAGDLKDGVAMAAESIDSGAARAKIEALARLTSAV